MLSFKKTILPLLSSVAMTGLSAAAQEVSQINKLQVPPRSQELGFVEKYLKEDALKETVNSMLGVGLALLVTGAIGTGIGLYRRHTLYKGKMNDYFTITINYLTSDDLGERKLKVIKMNSAWAKDLFGEYQDLEKRLRKLITRSMKDGKILVPTDFNDKTMIPLKEILGDFVKRTFAHFAFSRNTETLVAFLTCDDEGADNNGIIHPSIQVFPLKDLKFYQQHGVKISIDTIDMEPAEETQFLRHKTRLINELIEAYMHILSQTAQRAVRVTSLNADLNTIDD